MNPVNRMILVNLPSEEKNKPSFYLPDDMVANKKEHELVTVLSVAEDSKFYNVLKKDDEILVEGHMIVEANIKDKVYHLILENHVLARN
jgi:co-chaperonin GroES (HSP10)